mmetsp:Transcript_95226/g.164482  ORF Transcript_95226/g.164482 Transcript_95226/m.164482 type:complete len:286 (+) Transcript_95226:372-1229(+)
MYQDTINSDFGIDTVQQLNVLEQVHRNLILVRMDMYHPYSTCFFVFFNVLQSSVDLTHVCTLCEVHHFLVLQLCQLPEDPILHHIKVNNLGHCHLRNLGVVQGPQESSKQGYPRESGHDHGRRAAIVYVEIREHVWVQQHNRRECATDQQHAEEERHGVRVDLPGQGWPLHLHPETAKSKEAHDKEKRNRIDSRQQCYVSVENDTHGSTNTEEDQNSIMWRVPPGVHGSKELWQASIAGHPLEEAADADIAREDGSRKHQQCINSNNITQECTTNALCKKSNRIA